MTSLARALAGDLVGWTGLNPGVDEAGLRAAIDARWTPERDPRARMARTFRVVRGERAEPPERVDAWLPASETSVASLEYRPPDDLDHRAILADLGAPDVVLGSNHFEIGASVQEHVHAQRGITVAVAQPFPDEQGRSGDPYVAYVQLYPATTTQTYLTKIGQSGDALRPYPRPPA